MSSNMASGSFLVYGTPRPQGSKRLVTSKAGKTVMIEQSRYVRRYRRNISEMAKATFAIPFDRAVTVDIVFRFRRPHSHYLKSGKLSKLGERKTYMTSRPDLDKLVRSVLDGLSGVAFVDDSQVIAVRAWKEWGNGNAHTSVHITAHVENEVNK